MKSSNISWHHLLGEALLIVVSVFLAIALESMWQDRDLAEEARAALGQLLVELREDRLQVDSVIADQREIDQAYTDLQRWLSDAANVPAIEMQTALDGLAYTNTTMFVHRSAWTTMVAGGQFANLGDQSLVTRIGELYENVVGRLDMNSNNYDLELWKVMRETIPRFWDSNNRRLLTDDPVALNELRGQLRYLHRSWNQWYLEYLETYRRELDEVIAEVEAYLVAQGDEEMVR